MTVPGRAAEALAAAREPHVSALTAMEDSLGGSWSIEGIAEDEPVRPIVLTALALAAATVGTPPPDTVIEPLPDVDRQVLNRPSFPPIRSGRAIGRASGGDRGFESG